jgi:3'-5' exoribonuclease
MWVRELQIGTEIEAALLLREARLRTRRESSDLITLRVADRSGSLPAVVLEPTAANRRDCRSDEIAVVSGVVQDDPRFGPRLVITALRPARPDEYSLEDLRDGPPRPLARLEVDLRELVSTVRRPHLRQLLNDLLGEGTETWARFREAPAAKYYHQAYRHGLLEHSLTVAQAVSAISATFPGIDRDVAVAGALLHDIGKLDAYAFRRDRARLCAGPRRAGDDRRSLGRGCPRAAARHPQPSWLPRARKPRRAGHPRGDARPRDRHARGSARLL